MEAGLEAELEKLKELFDMGFIHEEEYVRRRAEHLGLHRCFSESIFAVSLLTPVLWDNHALKISNSGLELPTKDPFASSEPIPPSDPAPPSFVPEVSDPPLPVDGNVETNFVNDDRAEGLQDFFASYGSEDPHSFVRIRHHDYINYIRSIIYSLIHVSRILLVLHSGIFGVHMASLKQSRCLLMKITKM